MTAPKLRAAIAAMKPRFLLPEEFALTPPSEEARAAVSECAALPPERREEYAGSLPGRVAEQTLLVLGSCTPAEAEAVCVIAAAGGKRLALLYWYIFQYRYGEPFAVRAASEIAERMSPEMKKSPEAIRLRLFAGGEGIRMTAERLALQGNRPDEFFKAEQIIPESPLAAAVAAEYFSNCGKEELLRGGKWLKESFVRAEEPELSAAVSNYLKRLSEEEYLTPVNEALHARMGGPYASAAWAGIDDALKKKFLHWESLRLLMRHFPGDNRKLALLTRYLPQLRDIYFMRGEQTVVADFGEFVLIDEDAASPVSWLAEKERFAALRDDVDTLGLTGDPGGEKPLSARDYIIDEADSGVMRLDYSDMGPLYIRDTMDILLGLHPDDRSSNKLINVKKRTASRLSDE